MKKAGIPIPTRLPRLIMLELSRMIDRSLRLEYVERTTKGKKIDRVRCERFASQNVEKPRPGVGYSVASKSFVTAIVPEDNTDEPSQLEITVARPASPTSFPLGENNLPIIEPDSRYLKVVDGESPLITNIPQYIDREMDFESELDETCLMHVSPSDLLKIRSAHSALFASNKKEELVDKHALSILREFGMPLALRVSKPASVTLDGIVKYFSSWRGLLTHGKFDREGSETFVTLYPPPVPDPLHPNRLSDAYRDQEMPSWIAELQFVVGILRSDLKSW